MSTTKAPNAPLFRVGELAERTGLTVRALHHYDQIGLLQPSARTAAGHRLYSTADVARLYRINLLRTLGLSLDQVGTALDDPQWQLATALRRHLADSRRRAAVTAALARRLEAMLRAVQTHEELTAEHLITTLEEMAMLDTTVTGTTSLLVYADIPAAHAYLVRVFGLTPGPLERDDAGAAVHGEVRADQHVIWLHPVGEGYRSPADLGAVTGMTVVQVDDLDRHYAHTVAEGGGIVEEPVDQPYGVREYGARDAEGHLWFFHASLD